MEAAFCIETLEDALARHGKPEIFYTDQGSQFTGVAFTGVLADNGIAISMDGKGAWQDIANRDGLCSLAIAQIASVKVLGKSAFELSKDCSNGTVQIIFRVVVPDDPSPLRVPKHRETCHHDARESRWPIVIAPNDKRDCMSLVGSNVLGAIAYAPH